MNIYLANADSLHIPLADKSVHMIATSPPYWGLRDYGLGKWEGGDPKCDHVEAEIRTGLGLEELGKQYKGGGKKQGDIEVKQFGRECQKCGAVRSNPGLGLESLHDCLGWARGENCGECYVCRMRLWAAECWRVLRDDGTLWLNLGDSYNSSPAGANPGGFQGKAMKNNKDYDRAQSRKNIKGTSENGLKPKDLIGIPWRVALALQADGWWLRSDIIWAKSNPMPESVKDRPTKAHEYIFLLAKSKKYFYDIEAIRVPILQSSIDRISQDTFDSQNGGPKDPRNGGSGSRNRSARQGLENLKESHERGQGRNLRTVWDIPTTPYPGAHFACWPPDLVEPMIKAGTSEKGCCPECGAQWERVVKRGTAEMRPDNPNPVLPYTANGSTNHGTGSTTLHMTRERQTAGWRPTCKHNLKPIPCTVLDTFAGSGTTGQKARELGRKAILLDLSFDYLSEQAKSRLEFDRLEAWQRGGIGGGDVDPAALPLFREVMDLK